MNPTLYASSLSVFGWVIRGSFMAGILIVFVLILQFLLKNKLEARWKYLLWLPVAIRLLLPWAPESSLSLYNVLSLEAIAPGIHQQSQGPSAWGGFGRRSETAAHSGSFFTPGKSIIGQVAEAPGLAHESETAQESRFLWSRFKQMGIVNILMSVWLAGVVFLAVKTVYDQLRLKQALRAGRTIETPFLSALFHETKELLDVKREVGFVASEQIPGPAVVGFRKPTVVISPSLLITLQKDQLQYILAHEFAHIRRRDVALNWIIHTILILHWFNPLLWLAVHKARQDQEMACDACVLNRLSPRQNSAYGQTIIHVLEHFSGNHHQPGLAGLSATHKQMKRRLTMIKHFNKKSYRLSILGMTMILALGSVTLVNAKENDAGDSSQAAAAQLDQNSKATVNQPGFAVAARPNKSANVAAGKTQAENKGEKLRKAEIDRIEKLLEANPDDSYMVYVSNELTKRKGMGTFAIGNTSPENTSYEDYWKKASTLTEPAPKQPDDLPEGYSFVRSKIIGPYSGEYSKEMKAEAKKLGKQIYSKKINWTTTNFIRLEYKKGDDYILISSSRLDPQDKRHKGYVYETAEEARKNNPKLEEVFITNSVVWTENNKGLSIQTNPGNPLTKEELLKLAKTSSKK